MMRSTVANTVRRTLVQPSQRVSPVVVSTRFYSEAFKRKEKAQEEVFFRQREEEEIKKLKVRLANAEKEEDIRKLKEEEIKQLKDKLAKAEKEAAEFMKNKK
ncbi:ATPase inhibitor, mitochondrial [Entomortierella parvispora]|uniref:ATPase inhibitor, mitochondrial n=1 Tax=Entomortierella parvispora TaxID=205924 RepID=A0A9P3HBI6_9FUNG|nr:ATPase inhibitor, mitochondrial [Entomortierella parvispora]